MKRIAIDINDVLRDFTHQFITQYQKHIDGDFDIDDDEVTNVNYGEVFPFESDDAYKMFRYVDNAFELYGCAEPVDKMLPYRFNDWLQNTMRDFDEEDVPEIMLVSPLEANLTIQSTLAFLAKFASRVREIYFPVDSSTVWDRCDILITANPLFLNNVPENKTVIKINKPYNKDIETEYSFDSMMDVINDKEEIMRKMIEEND